MPSKIRDIAEILGVTETANTTNAVLTSVADGSGLVVYATLDDLPTSGLTAGDQAYVTSTNRLYVSNGTGWYNVALFNATPTLSISPSGAVTLAVDGSTPTVITLTGTDSDNADANLVYSVESDGSFSNIATLSQDSSVFTITPLAEGVATPGSSTLTFKVSDGISFGSGTTTFSLAFGIDWSTSSFTTTTYGSYDPTSSGNNPSYFGADIKFSQNGDRLITSAEQGSMLGNIFVYTQNGSTYNNETVLYPANSGVTIGSSGAGFGNSIDMTDAGDRIVTNWNGYHTGTYSYHGAWLVYSRSGSTWTREAGPIFSNQSVNNAYFANKVAISGDGTHIVATRPSASNNFGQGYLYYRSGTTWTIRQGFSAAATSNDRYGSQVYLTSDAFRVLVLGGSTTGKFWVHTLTNNDYQNNLEYSGNTGGGCRQGAINSTGDYVVIGNEAAKTVWIYNRVGTTWSLQQTIGPITLLGDGVTTVYNFGYSVALNDAADVLLVGNRDSYPSTIWIYERNGSTWTKSREIDESAIDPNDAFNSYGQVAIDGDGTVFAGGGWYTTAAYAGGAGNGIMKTYVP